MSWQYPCRKSDVTGRQILTREKPITKAYAAIEELQGKVATDADVQIDGMEISEAYIENNALVLRGSVHVPDNTDLKRRITELEWALQNIQLKLNLAQVVHEVKIMGMLKIGEHYGTLNDGTGIEVEGC